MPNALMGNATGVQKDKPEEAAIRTPALTIMLQGYKTASAGQASGYAHDRRGRNEFVTSGIVNFQPSYLGPIEKNQERSNDADVNETLRCPGIVM